MDLRKSDGVFTAPPPPPLGLSAPPVLMSLVLVGTTNLQGVRSVGFGAGPGSGLGSYLKETWACRLNEKLGRL